MEPKALKKATGVSDFMAMKFDDYPFADQWADAFGQPEKNFKMIIYGPEKNGKTDFCLKLCKYLAQWGKVYYNSHEEGKSKTLKDAFIRNTMQDVAGRVMLLHKEPFTDLMQRLAMKGSPRFLVIDSLDYMEITEKQYKTLVSTFPRKSIIMLSWEDTKQKPLRDASKKIAKRVDIVAYVKGGIVYPTSRFGGNKPLKFWDKPTSQAGTQLSLIQ